MTERCGQGTWRAEKKSRPSPKTVPCRVALSLQAGGRLLPETDRVECNCQDFSTRSKDTRAEPRPGPATLTLPTLEHASWANSERSPCEFMRGLAWLVRNLNPSDQISTRRSGSDSDKNTPVVKKSTSRMLFALILHCDSSVILPPLPLKISGRV